MKRIITTAVFALCVSVIFAQIKVVAPDGDVGIGESSPGAKLTIKSNASATRAFQVRSAAGVELVKLNEASNGSGLFQFNNSNGVGKVLLNPQGKSYILGGKTGFGESSPLEQVHVNGDAYKTQGGDLWSIPSDKKLKRNIAQFENGLDIVLGINTVQYEYNGKAGTTAGESQIGVVAQELEEVAPFMVRDRVYTKTDIDEFGNETVISTENIKTVNASSLKWILVNAIKEQQVQIEEKDQLIADLAERLATIEAKMDNASFGMNQTTVELNGYDLAQLDQNRPNPFNGTTDIAYIIPTDSNNASINILDSSGRMIKKITLDHAGEGNLTINANNIPSGAYSYQLEVDGKVVETKQMVLTK